MPPHLHDPVPQLHGGGAGLDGRIVRAAHQPLIGAHELRLHRAELGVCLSPGDQAQLRGSPPSDVPSPAHLRPGSGQSRPNASREPTTVADLDHAGVGQREYLALHQLPAPALIECAGPAVVPQHPETGLRIACCPQRRQGRVVQDGSDTGAPPPGQDVEAAQLARTRDVGVGPDGHCAYGSALVLLRQEGSKRGIGERYLPLALQGIRAWLRGVGWEDPGVGDQHGAEMDVDQPTGVGLIGLPDANPVACAPEGNASVLLDVGQCLDHRSVGILRHKVGVHAVDHRCALVADDLADLHRVHPPPDRPRDIAVAQQVRVDPPLDARHAGQVPDQLLDAGFGQELVGAARALRPPLEGHEEAVGRGVLRRPRSP